MNSIDFDCPKCGYEMCLEVEPGEGPLDSECDMCQYNFAEEAMEYYYGQAILAADYM